MATGRSSLHRVDRCWIHELTEASFKQVCICYRRRGDDAEGREVVATLKGYFLSGFNQ